MLRLSILAGHMMGPRATLAIAALPGLSLRMGLRLIRTLPCGTAKLLRKTKTPTRFGGAHCIISGSIRPQHRRQARQTSLSLRQVRPLLLKSRLLSRSDATPTPTATANPYADFDTHSDNFSHTHADSYCNTDCHSAAHSNPEVQPVAKGSSHTRTAAIARTPHARVRRDRSLGREPSLLNTLRPVW